jgi:hypothetical protein
MKISKARSKLNTFVAQIKANAGFRSQIESDPLSALVSAGISREEFDEILDDGDLDQVYGGLSCTPRGTESSCNCCSASKSD